MARATGQNSHGGRRPLISHAVTLYVVIAAAAAGGIYTWDRATRESVVTNPNDPAVRAKAAAQTITGEPTVRRVIVDEPGIVTVEARSKYYRPDAPPAENRQYLATEGRLIVQLILHDVPDLMAARVVLFSVGTLFDSGTRLAVIVGSPNQKYEGYRVTYEGPLSK